MDATELSREELLRRLEAVEAERDVLRRSLESSAPTISEPFELGRPQFEAFADSMPQIVWTSGPDGSNRYLNARWFEYTGATPEACRERGTFAWIHPDDVAGVKDRWQTATATRSSFDFTYRLKQRDGTFRWHSGRSTPMLDAQGRVVLWVGTATDIDAHVRTAERLQVSEDRYRTVVLATSTINWISNSEGMVSTGLDSIADFTGLTTDGILGLGWLEAIHPEDRPRVEEAWSQAIARLSMFESEYRIRRHDGVYRHFWVRGIPVREPDGSVREWVGACTDITERKEAEAALASAHEQLQRHAASIEAEIERRSEQLVESESRFRSLFEQSPIAILLLSPDGRCLDANTAMSRMTGYDYDEMTSWIFGDISFPEDVGTTVDLIAEINRGDRDHFEVERRYRHKDGHEIWAMVTYFVQRAPSGQPLRLYVILVDTTAAKTAQHALARRTEELAEQRNFVARMLENMPGGFAYLDRDLVFQMVNPVYAQAFQRPLDSMQGRHLFDVFPGTEPQIEHLLRSVFETGETFRSFSHPFVIQDEGGTRELFWDFTYHPMCDERGLVAGIVVLCFEVTPRVMLEREVAAQTEALRAAYDELQRADRYKDEFFSVISHELRTPLNFIMGFASLLDDEIGGDLNTQQHEFVGRILSGADRMLGLVNNLLDMSRMAAGEFEVRLCSTDYATLVAEATAALHPLMVEKPLDLIVQVDVPQVVPVDPQRIVQVLTNLLDNAIKFTPAGGRLALTARLFGGDILTEVTDTGPGIAAEDVPKLFTRFKQLDMSSTRLVGGSGLGLSITKGIVEAHGGTIGVRSTPGQGSMFWFTLPVDARRDLLPEGAETAST